MGKNYMDLSKNYDVFKYNALAEWNEQINELDSKEYKRVSAVHEALLQRLTTLDEDINTVDSLSNAKRIQIALIEQAKKDVLSIFNKRYIRYCDKHSIIDTWGRNIYCYFMFHDLTNIEHIMEFLGSKEFINCWILTK